MTARLSRHGSRWQLGTGLTSRPDANVASAAHVWVAFTARLRPLNLRALGFEPRRGELAYGVAMFVATMAP